MISEPMPGIPALSDMKALERLAKAGSEAAANRWLKGAIFWYCRKRRWLGLLPPLYSEGLAYEAAMSVGDAKVEFVGT